MKNIFGCICLHSFHNLTSESVSPVGQFLARFLLPCHPLNSRQSLDTDISTIRETLRQDEGPPSMLSWLWASMRLPDSLALSECKRPCLYSRFWANSDYTRKSLENYPAGFLVHSRFFLCCQSKGILAATGCPGGLFSICVAECYRLWPRLSGPWLSWRKLLMPAMNHSAKTAHNCLICVFTSQI